MTGSLRRCCAMCERLQTTFQMFTLQKNSLSHLKSFCYSAKSFAHLVKSCSCKRTLCFSNSLTVSERFAYFVKDNFSCVCVTFSLDGFSLYIFRRYYPEPQGTTSLIFSLLCLLAHCLFRPKQTKQLCKRYTFQTLF